jgi:hypothetical protein
MAAPPASAAPAFSAPPAALPAMMPFSALPPQPRARPGSVTFLAVLGFIGAGFVALAGLVLLLGGSFLGALVEKYADQTDGGAVAGGVAAIVFAVVGVVALLLAALEFFIARGLLKGRNWARITQLVLSFIGLAVGLPSLLLGNFPSVLGLAMNVASIVILFSRDAKAYFEQPRPMV